MAVLLHGDCLEVMKLLPDKSVDLFVCDLPYGCLTTPRATNGPGWRKELAETGQKTLTREEKGACAWDVKIDLAAFWVQVKRLCKDDHTPVLMFCTTKFGYDLIHSNPDWFRYDLVWSKTCAGGFLCANKMPLRSHEMIYVFSKKGAGYTRVDVEGDYPASHYSNHKRSETSNVVPRVKDYGTIGGSVYDCGSTDRTTPITRVPVREGIRCVKSVIEVANKKGKGQHPTQKPDDLYAWLIERYSKEGDTVLDPTAGSFASVFTAQAMGRKAIGIEMDKGFYDKAIEKNAVKE